jgi:hypothetical protein
MRRARELSRCSKAVVSANRASATRPMFQSYSKFRKRLVCRTSSLRSYLLAVIPMQIAVAPEPSYRLLLGCAIRWAARRCRIIDCRLLNSQVPERSRIDIGGGNFSDSRVRKEVMPAGPLKLSVPTGVVKTISTVVAALLVLTKLREAGPGTMLFQKLPLGSGWERPVRSLA